MGHGILATKWSSETKNLHIRPLQEGHRWRGGRKKERVAMKNQYNPSYEDGKCPLGFEYVSGYIAGGRSITPYCRKIKRFRFRDPITAHEKAEENRKAVS